MKPSKGNGVALPLVAVFVIVFLAVGLVAGYLAVPKGTITTTVTQTATQSIVQTSTATATTTATQSVTQTATKTATQSITQTATTTALQTITQTTTTTTTSSSSSGGYDFLIYTQKGYVEVASPSGSVLGYERLFNISDSITAQIYYWVEYPIQGLVAPTFLLPLNNGTVKIVNSTSMKVMNTINVGTSAAATGFIGVAVNSNQTLGAVVDGPSGVVEVVNLQTTQVVLRHIYNTTAGATAYPCDVRWTPNGNSLVIPMRNNNTVVTLNPTNGAITADAIFPAPTEPYMLNVNSQGTLVATELSGNKTDVFLTLPGLKPVGDTILNATNFSPVRGVFTPNGAYYLVASSTSNVVDVISTSNYKVVNTLDLPPSSSPGLSDMALTPDSNYAYVVMHGTPTTGGVVYLIPLANVATISALSLLSSVGSITLTTAPAIAIPISTQSATSLVNNVLLPPVTGLHD